MFFTDPNRDYATEMKNWWRGMPAYTKLVIYVSIGTYILSWLNSAFIPLFINIPIFTIENLQIWRVFTSPFITLNLLTLIFEMCSYLPIAYRTELRLGTAKYGAFFIMNFIILEVLYAASLYGLSFIPSLSLLAIVPTAGLFPLIMAEIVINCNINPEAPSSFFLCPIQIKAKYFPWVYLVVLSLIVGVMWDLLIGILIGYFHVYKWMNFTYISDEKTKFIDNLRLIVSMKNYTNYISLSNAGNDSFSLGGQGYSKANINQPNTQTKRSQPFVPFEGAGYRLGGDESNGSERFNRHAETENSKEDDPLI
ncbi:unnamed protein product [Blepharisma stoltei]|uniref:Derlin n=1 Tax=Blepharisma stoltei TaxID=1481888 RepID=A0AAU9IIF6_9CILI|nr:unnamed protein product [Blepharisma stoltei]